MKKVSQKTVSLITAFTFVLVAMMPISAQSPPINGVVIVDDVSGIVNPMPEAKSLPVKISTQESKITFKGNYILSGATTVTISIIDPITNTKVIKISSDIQNTVYLIKDLDISMLSENKWYNINVSFNGNIPASQNGQIRRVVSKAKNGVKNNN